MSISHALSSPSTVTHRALLFGSLALNLFFIGVAAALFVNSPTPPARNVAARIERLALSLPSPDGDKLRVGYAAERAAVEAARAEYDRARDSIRAALRREPFDSAAMGEAMSKARAARQSYDQLLQGVIARAAGEMSAAGRQAMAEWQPSRGGRR